MEAMSAITLSGISKSYRSGVFGGRITALSEVDLTVAEGEIVGLVGPNGAGKSTLLLIIAGMLRPDAGHVAVEGKDVQLGGTGAAGYATERTPFDMSLSAQQMLVSLARLRGQSRASARASARHALTTAGLEEDADRRIRTLSRGMLQRLALAQALIGEPRVVLMDETLSGVDPIVHRNICEVIRALPRRGVTLILSSHDLFAVQQLADRVVVLSDGTVRGALAAGQLTGASDLQRRFFELIGTPALRAVS
jgi:ABC-type multidrug transport system ATPase subunit